MMRIKSLPLALVLAGLTLAVPPASQVPPFTPIDPQKVQDQETMTWADYRPIPGAT